MQYFYPCDKKIENANHTILMIKKSYLLLLLILFVHYVKAQNFYHAKYKNKYLITAGIGPSFMYADNGGQYRTLDFYIKPSLDLSLSRPINNHLLLRGTIGSQFVKGKQPIKSSFEANSNVSTSSFKGTGYTFDLTFTGFLKPFQNVLNQPKLNLYINSGIGWVFMRNQFISNESSTSNELFLRNSIYIPLRLGTNYQLNKKNGIGIEATALLTLSDKLDGLNASRNLSNDHFAQLKIFYVRFISAQ
jgi:hypothetical protein